MRTLIPAILLASLATAAPAPAKAAQSYDNCTGFIDSVPATITTQGVWCLRADLSTAIASGNAITIATNNVTVDCNDFKLGGLAAGPATNAYGVYSDNRLNSVVRNCNIRGFQEGVFLIFGGGHVVENSRFDGITFIGIRVNSPNTTVRGNLLSDTGGSTSQSSFYGIVAATSQGGIDVIGNTVNGVTGSGAGHNAYGIWLSGMSSGSISHNRVRGVIPGDGGTSGAIFGNSSGRQAVHDNVVHGSNVAGSFGIVCRQPGNRVQQLRAALSQSHTELPDVGQCAEPQLIPAYPAARVGHGPILVESSYSVEEAQHFGETPVQRLPFLLALTLALPVPAAHAAEGFDNCSGFIDSVPAVITTQGVWCMRADLSSNIGGGTLVLVQTNNVTIDCNHFKLGGLGGGAGTATRGIAATDQLNLTVRNCNIRGFYYGINAQGGGGHLVENNRFEANRYVGLSVTSPGSMVRGNILNDTGNTSLSTGATFGINVANGVDVVDNTVNGVSSLQASANVYGIFTNGNGRGAVVSNRVRDLAPGSGGTTFGVWNQGFVRTVASDNTIVGTMVPGSIAIRCGDGAGSAFSNTVAGYPVAVSGCTPFGTLLNDN